MTADNSNGRAIYVAIVVDVTRLLASAAEAEEGADAADAQTIKRVGPDSEFVLATTAAQTVRQASNRIAVEVSDGDTVRFYAKSGSNNFDDGVLIEDMSPISDRDSLQDFALLSFERSIVVPNGNADVLPARFSEQDFWFWQCVVTTDGEPHCNVLLAVYDRDEQGRPRLAGRYRWVLQLTVKLTPPPRLPTEEKTS